MQVKTTQTINGIAVTEAGRIQDIIFYYYSNIQCTEVILVRKDKVIGTISADCSHNTGFIDQIREYKEGDPL